MAVAATPVHRVQASVAGRSVCIDVGAPDSRHLLFDTFTPEGVLGVTLAGPPDSAQAIPPEAPVSHIQEVVLGDLERAALFTDLTRTAARAPFELTIGVYSDSYLGDDYTVFVLDQEATPNFVVRSGARVSIFRGLGPAAARWLTRVVRDFATRLAIVDGSIIFHASAFASRGVAYLVCGDSGAGKSTLGIGLPKILSRSAWLGNDRIHLFEREDGTWVTACPLPLAVNRGSLEAIGVKEYSGWQLHAGHPAAESDWTEFHGEDKMKLSHREIQDYLDVPVAAGGKLGGFLFPQVVSGGTYSWAAASLPDLEPVLRRNCFSLADNLYPRDWLFGTSPPLAGDVLFRRFLETHRDIPAFRCRYAPRPGELERLSGDFTNAFAA